MLTNTAGSGNRLPNSRTRPTTRPVSGSGGCTGSGTYLKLYLNGTRIDAGWPLISAGVKTSCFAASIAASSKPSPTGGSLRVTSETAPVSESVRMTTTSASFWSAFADSG